MEDRIEKLEKENKELREHLHMFMKYIAEDSMLIGNMGAPILKSQDLQKVIIDFREYLKTE